MYRPQVLSPSGIIDHDNFMLKLEHALSEQIDSSRRAEMQVSLTILSKITTRPPATPSTLQYGYLACQIQPLVTLGRYKVTEIILGCRRLLAGQPR